MSTIPFARIRHWMFDEALPYWGAAGVDGAYGGFEEELSLEGKPTEVPFKRVRAQCRQIYVFSHAALMGWTPGRALSDMGYAYLVERAWLGEGKGWARLLSRQGDVIDATPDLYDIAFVLFALAWRYRLTRDAEVLGRIEQTLAFVKTHMSAGTLGGYWHALPPQGPRLQNPHMHLLEATLALIEATGERGFMPLADEIVALVRTRFFDGVSLGEYFEADLTRVGGEQGRVLEPGHQFEWAWILAAYQRLSGVDVSAEAVALAASAERFVDARTGATVDEARNDGAVVRGTSRTWPNTERLKGQLALFELMGQDTRPAIAQSALLLLDRYLNTEPRGLWLDQFDVDGRLVAQAAPASTFYHLFLAFAETLRLEARLGG